MSWWQQLTWFRNTFRTSGRVLPWLTRGGRGGGCPYLSPAMPITCFRSSETVPCWNLFKWVILSLPGFCLWGTGIPKEGNPLFLPLTPHPTEPQPWSQVVLCADSPQPPAHSAQVGVSTSQWREVNTLFHAASCPLLHLSIPSLPALGPSPSCLAHHFTV